MPASATVFTPSVRPAGEVLTLHQLHDLRAALPDLNFAINEVDAVPSPSLADQYLAYYGLNFAAGYFHRWGRVMLPRYTIACHYWLPTQQPVLPEKGMVVVVHGYFDHVGLFGNLIRYLLEQGYGVVAFDLPGHGLSSGEPASIETFDHYVEVFDDICAKLRQKFPVPISAIGQSTGGAIILKYLAADNTGLEKVCVLSPLVEPALWWLNKIVYLLSHRFRKSVKRAFRSNSADNEFLAFLKNNDPLQARTIPLAWLGAMKGWIEESHAMAPNNYPVTIIQGDRDTTVRWRKNLKILAKKFPAAKIIKIAGAHHHLVNEVQPLRDRIYQQMGF